MGVAVNCDQCGKKFNLKDEYAGRRVKCPNCSAPLVIPQLELETLPDDAFEAEPAPKPVRLSSVPLPLAAPGNKMPAIVWGMVAVALALVLVAGVLAVALFRTARPQIAQVHEVPDGGQLVVLPPESALPGKRATVEAAPVPPAKPELPPRAKPDAATSTASPPPFGDLPQLPPGLENVPKGLDPQTKAKYLETMKQLQQQLNTGAPPDVPQPADAGPIPYQWQAIADKPQEPVAMREDRAVEIPLLSTGLNLAYPSAPSPYLLTMGAEGQATHFELWDLRINTRKGEFKLQEREPRVAVLSPDGALVAFELQGDHHVHVWSTVNGGEVSKLEADSPFGVGHLNFVGSDKLIGQQSRTYAVALWDAKTGRKLRDVPLRGVRLIDRMAVSPSEKFVAVIAENALHVNELVDGGVTNRIPLPKVGDAYSPRCSGLAFAPDGTQLAAMFESAGDYNIVCWNLSDGQVAAQHKVKAGKRYRVSGSVTPLPLAWLPSSAGWIIHGATMVDREKGGPIWTLSATTEGARYPIRLLDEHTLLAIHYANSAETLVSIPLSADEIAAGRKMIASGGSLQDLGLPAMAKADLSSAVDLDAQKAPNQWSVEVEPIAVQPANQPTTVELAKSESALRHVFFGSPASSAVFAWCRGVALDDAPAAVRPMSLEQYDLKTGGRVGAIDVSFAGDLLAVRGDGKQLLMVPTVNRERLDVIDATTGKHVVGWRPVPATSDRSTKDITWARFVGNDMAVVRYASDKVSLWKLPECKAILTASLAKLGGPPAISPDQKYLAFVRKGGIVLVDVKTGQVCGECLTRNSEAAGLTMLVSGRVVAFNPAGDRVALLLMSTDISKLPKAPDYASMPRYGRYGPPAMMPPSNQGPQIRDDAFGGLICIWDLRTGQKEREFAVPRSAAKVAWCGEKHLLLDDAYLVDLERQMLTWKYGVKNGRVHSDSTDGRTWYTTANALGQPLLLMAQPLPDAAVVRATADAKDVKPLYGSGMKVKLTVTLQNTPPEREATREELVTLLTRKLVLNGSEVADSAPTKMLLNIEERRTTESLKLKVQGLAEAGDLGIPVTELIVNMAIQGEADQVLWSAATTIKTDEHGPPRPPIPPPGMAGPPKPLPTDIKSLLAERQWGAVIGWIESQTLPGAIYPPTYREGLGESLLTPQGVETIRAKPATAGEDRKT